MLGDLISGIFGFIGGNEASDAASDAAKANARTAKEIYDDQTARYEPFRQGGIAGLNGMMALMGLPPVEGGGASMGYGGGGSVGGGDPASAYLQRYPEVAQAYQDNISKQGFRDRFGTPEKFANWHYETFGPNEGRVWGNEGGGMGGGLGRDLTGLPGADPNGGQASPMEYLQSTPGYQFRLQTGTDALDNSAAARGGLRSGAHLKDLETFGQNFATNEMDNAMRRFASLMNPGLTATQGQNAAGSNYGGAVSNSNNQMANADIMKWGAYGQGAAGLGSAAQGAMSFFG